MKTGTSFNPPINILVKSDDNELTYQKTTKTKNGNEYSYIYTKSICFLGDVIVFSEKELEYQLSNNFKII